MDRFEIIRDVDPFANMPRGDGFTYEIMGEKFKGWRIDETNLILDLSENSLNYLLTLKKKEVTIYNPKEPIPWQEYFEIIRVVDKTPYKDNRTRTKRVKVQFEGQKLIPF